MFEELGSRVSNIISKMVGRGVITDSDFDDAMRQIRIALLEADVPLSVITQLLNSVRSEVIGKEILKQVSPAQMIIKVVHDSMVKLLGEPGDEKEILDEDGKAIIMLAGLQGAGKTTTAAKLAFRLKSKFKKNVLLVSLDVYRPAAISQLQVLGKTCGIDVLPTEPGDGALDIARRVKIASDGYDVVILDTAGRTNVDAAMMEEIKQIKEITEPRHVIYVGDATMGQAVRKIAQQFDEAISITAIILTKADSDASSGNALAMRTVTGKPIKYVCTGEKIDNISVFSPARMANRILGMGDVVSLVEKASENFGEIDVKNMGEKLKKGGFDLDDYAMQLNLLNRMGGLKGIMSFLPANFSKGLGQANINQRSVTLSLAMISSMTPYERKKPECIEESNSRKKRIASGAGSKISDLTQMLRQFSQIKEAAKQLASLDSGKGGALMDMIKKLKA